MQCLRCPPHLGARRVSVLFSEPKIPQLLVVGFVFWSAWSFSALQRAENSSIEIVDLPHRARCAFQCSSASRKFLNPNRARPAAAAGGVFQCSSASRKFLNTNINICATSACSGFSALQRAENSSIAVAQIRPQRRSAFQCSSASRKFLNSPPTPRSNRHAAVSVLFSEPKIPQSRRQLLMRTFFWSFSALQRAENSSISPEGG